MKKTTVIILTALLLLGLSACGSEQGSHAEGAIGAVIREALDPNAPEDISGKLGDVMRTTTIDFSVSEVKAEANRFIAHLSVENTTEASLSLSTSDFLLVGTTGGQIFQKEPLENDILTLGAGATGSLSLSYELSEPLQNGELTYVGELNDEAGDMYLVAVEAAE